MIHGRFDKQTLGRPLPLHLEACALAARFLEISAKLSYFSGGYLFSTHKHGPLLFQDFGATVRVGLLMAKLGLAFLRTGGK